jgi:hypothetical protein
MWNNRLNRSFHFCESVVQAVFAEAEKYEVSPKYVMMKCLECYNNKAIAIDKANSSRQESMMNAMRAIFQEPSQMFEKQPDFGCNQSSCSIGPMPKRILYSGNRTIVFWNDGDKTVVKCSEGQEFEEYNGFVAALAKKMYGSTSKAKKIIEKTKQYQD